MNKLNRFIFYIVLFISFVLFSSYYVIAVDRVPQGVALDSEGEVKYTVLISTQAQAGEFYRGGRPRETELLGYRARSILGQRFIGVGFDSTNNRKVELGLERIMNYEPVINATAINANKTLSKHPHTNNTLMCSVNITEKDIGDRLTIHVKWYRNSTDWYDNSLDINYGDLQDLVDANNIQFELWPYNNETWRHTMIGQSFYPSRTAPFRMYEIYDTRVNVGSISPESTSHYDLWICSVQVFDGTKRTEWVNSTPMFIFNHRPDYDNSMRTYYSWREDESKTIDLGSFFSDIDHDTIAYYINYTSGPNPNRFSIANVDININQELGEVTFIPDDDITGFMDLIFTGIDQNDSITSDWYLRNDYGQTSTDVLTLNILQVNDPPWASDVYITSSLPGYRDTLTCVYTYNDIENHPENLDSVSYKWYIQYEGLGPWILLDNNSSILSNDNFDLGDRIICSVRVKDIYYDWPGYSWLRTNAFGRIIASTYDDKENPYETFKNVVSDGDWYNIVNTIDLENNRRRIFVNGVLEKESTDVIDNLDDLINWRLGQRDGSFQGRMDEVAIWDKELTEEEVFELYHGNIFGYKFYGEEFTGNEAIIIDLDGDGRYTASPDLLFVDNSHLLALNPGDQLYRVNKNHRIFSDSSDPNEATCIYLASEFQMNDGVVPEENYFLGEDCANYGGTFISPADILISEEHNWAINTPQISSSTSFIYESFHGSLTYSNQADIIVSNAINPAPDPVNGGILSSFPHNIVYYDTNDNGVYDNGEPIINDVNCNLIFNLGSDVVMRGSFSSDGLPLRRFDSGARVYPLQNSLNDNLVAYYNFNDDLLDQINSHHGTNFGTSLSSGIGCNARQFTKESYIDLDLEKNNLYSISMWVNFDSLPIFPWQYTPENLPNMPWLYSGDDVDQSLWSLSYTNSSAVTVLLESTDPTDEGQIVIGIG